MHLIAAPAALRTHARRFAGCARGVFMTEFALIVPLALLIGLGGIETAHYVLARLRVGQIAETVADNAGRVRQALDETDINEIMIGGKLMGDSIDFAANGRIILSDLEQRTNTAGGAASTGAKTTDNPNGYRQWIRWQRCAGALNVASSFGGPIDKNGNAVVNLDDTTNTDHGAVQTKSTIDGMGPAGQQIAATSGTATMVVEVIYTYQPIIASFAMGPQQFDVVQAFNIRQRTDFSVYNANGVAGNNRADCRLFNQSIPTG